MQNELIHRVFIILLELSLTGQKGTRRDKKFVDCLSDSIGDM
jgi:hypothetical protein